MGLRPQMSDREPQMGVEAAWARMNAEPSHMYPDDEDSEEEGLRDETMEGIAGVRIVRSRDESKEVRQRGRRRRTRPAVVDLTLRGTVPGLGEVEESLAGLAGWLAEGIGRSSRGGVSLLSLLLVARWLMRELGGARVCVWVAMMPRKPHWGEVVVDGKGEKRAMK